MPLQDGTAKGSARSIERFHLVEALAKCADLLDRFGGHAMAAGLTVRADRVVEFSKRFGEIASTRLSTVDLVPVLLLDAYVLLPLDCVSYRQHISRLEPCLC